MNKARIEEVKQYLGNCCWKPPKYECSECGKEWESDVELQENFAGIRRASHPPSLWEKIGLCEECWNGKKSEILEEKSKKKKTGSFVSRIDSCEASFWFFFFMFVMFAYALYLIDIWFGLITIVLTCVTLIPFYVFLHCIGNDEEHRRFKEEILTEELLLRKKENSMMSENENNRNGNAKKKYGPH